MLRHSPILSIVRLTYVDSEAGLPRAPAARKAQAALIEDRSLCNRRREGRTIVPAQTRSGKGSRPGGGRRAAFETELVRRDGSGEGPTGSTALLRTPVGRASCQDQTFQEMAGV